MLAIAAGFFALSIGYAGSPETGSEEVS